MRLTLDLETELPEADRLLNFCIYIAPQPHQLLVLNGNQTLHQVNDKFWKVSQSKVNTILFPFSSIPIFFCFLLYSLLFK